MKTKILLLVLLCFPIFIWGQDKTTAQVNSDEVTVTPPKFKGIVKNNNLDVLSHYLNNEIVYPEKAVECCEQGTAIVKFMVTVKGELNDFRIINSVCPMLDEELIRAVKTTDGMWEPGYNNEKPVAMEKEVSMMFVADPIHNHSSKKYFEKLATRYAKKGNTLLLGKNNPKKALSCFNESIKYMPYDASALLLRGLCKYELGDREGARNDWERINEIGNYDADPWIENVAYLPGFEEMMAIVEKEK